MERKINHKVGVKVLTEAQLENVLPTYENFFQKVEVCRDVAQKELLSLEKRHYQYNFMYDNVFSFLGKRGTGKTSVAFTLQKMIKEKYEKVHHDVVLPLIIPEVIPDNCTVLGWILAIVGEEIGKLEEEIKDLQKKARNEEYWSRCRYMEEGEDKESLKAKLDNLSQLFYAGSYNPSNEASYYKAVDNSVQQAADYYKFGKDIAEVWDAWVKRIQYAHELKATDEATNKQICPMIYFIFDDVDLAPEKIEELLSVIIKYLSHPNIIVLTTADESLFLEVTEKSLDRKIGRLPGEWRQFLAQKPQASYDSWRRSDLTKSMETEDLISRTARMYLGKVMPTSTRYYLRLFNTAKQKENFCLEDKESLGAAITREIQLLVDCCTKGTIHNFMISDGGIVNFYLKFFGNTSRQIGNVYIAFQELVKTFQSVAQRTQKETLKKETALSKIYQNFRNFLSIAINANHELAKAVENVEEFVDEVYKMEYNQWKMYINYSYLNEFLNNSLSKKSKQKKIQISMQLYALLIFGENLLLIMEYALSEGITGRKKIHAVPFLVEYIGQSVYNERKLFRDDLEPNEFFGHYVNLLDRLEFIVENRRMDAKFNMEYFYDFREYSGKKIERNVELLTIYHNNPQWFKQLAGMLSLVYGNTYLIGENDIRECLIAFDKSYLTAY